MKEENTINENEAIKSENPQNINEATVEPENTNKPENANDSTDEPEKEEATLTDEEKIEALQAEISNLKDAMLYKVAEFENYRKRTLKEKADLILNGGRKVMEALLPVADDLERANMNLEKAQDVEALRQGQELVFQKFIKTLEGLGLKRMDVIGQDFSTDFHEAVAFVPGSEEQKGRVIDCIQNGYMLNEKVLRYAKVAVGQ